MVTEEQTVVLGQQYHPEALVQPSRHLEVLILQVLVRIAKPVLDIPLTHAVPRPGAHPVIII